MLSNDTKQWLHATLSAGELKSGLNCRYECIKIYN